MNLYKHYTQVNMVRTIEQILGLPPMNQMDMAATPMRDAFMDTPDPSPYVFQTSSTATAKAAMPAPVPREQLRGMARRWADASSQMDFSGPDRVEAGVLNRALWYSSTGFSRPYPGDTRVLAPEEVLGGRLNVTGPEPDERAPARLSPWTSSRSAHRRQSGTIPRSAAASATFRPFGCPGPTTSSRETVTSAGALPLTSASRTAALTLAEHVGLVLCLISLVVAVLGLRRRATRLS